MRGGACHGGPLLQNRAICLISLRFWLSPLPELSIEPPSRSPVMPSNKPTEIGSTGGSLLSVAV
jgi:hypothetical protein